MGVLVLSGGLLVLMAEAWVSAYISAGILGLRPGCLAFALCKEANDLATGYRPPLDFG